MVQHMLSWMDPKPSGEHRRFGMSLLTSESHRPYRCGSLPSCSGNHQACDATTTPSLTLLRTSTFMLHLPNMFSMVIHSPSTMPYFWASAGLMVAQGSGSISRRDATCRCSEWNDVYLRMPVVSESA